MEVVEEIVSVGFFVFWVPTLDIVIVVNCTVIDVAICASPFSMAISFVTSASW